mmetsp:Transcript_30379/g.73945  ORF Transcript_30379/g.73945 Transcript_30379/m.73945 type:complete len:149 (-) Transcript_30379:647-1093(-)
MKCGGSALCRSLSTLGGCRYSEIRNCRIDQYQDDFRKAAGNVSWDSTEANFENVKRVETNKLCEGNPITVSELKRQWKKFLPCAGWFSTNLGASIESKKALDKWSAIKTSLHHSGKPTQQFCWCVTHGIATIPMSSSSILTGEEETME